MISSYLRSWSISAGRNHLQLKEQPSIIWIRRTSIVLKVVLLRFLFLLLGLFQPKLLLLLLSKRRPTFIGIFKKKDTEDFSTTPYLATFLNCMLWVFCGIVVSHNTLL